MDQAKVDYLAKRKEEQNQAHDARLTRVAKLRAMIAQAEADPEAVIDMNANDLVLEWVLRQIITQTMTIGQAKELADAALAK